MKQILTPTARFLFAVLFGTFLTASGVSGAGATVYFVESGQALGTRFSTDVALGDLDGDGDLDAFVTNLANAGIPEPNTVWRNDGNGRFTDTGQTLGPNLSNVVALGDVDNDGDLDAVVGNIGPNKLWLNDGTASFTDSGQLLGGHMTEDVALGDIDGDGDLDAVAANGMADQGNTIWRNQGGAQGGTAGQFLPSQQTLGFFETSAIGLADVDGDGDLDAMTSTRDRGQGQNLVWLNDGSGVFQAGAQPPHHEEAAEIAMGDLDGDGDLDAFMVGGFFGAMQIWFNQGGLQGGTPGEFAEGPQNELFGSTNDVQLGDLDGDGDLDAFVAETYRNAPNRIMLNDGTGVFTTTTTLGGSHSSGVALGDVNGDGRLDAFVANQGEDLIAQPNIVWLNLAESQSAPGADLAISITADNGVQAPFVSTSYQVNVVNNGTADAANLAVRITGFINSPTWIGGQQGRCSLSGSTVCRLTSLAAGETVGLRFEKLDFASSGQVHTTVSVASTTQDPNQTNNIDRASVAIVDCESATLCWIEEVFCEARLTPRIGFALLGAFLPDLPLYYQVRDDILEAAPDGQRLAGLYYQHSPELVRLLASDKEFQDSSIAALTMWEPNLRALVEGKGASVTVTAEQVTSMNAVLDRLAEIGSPELQTMLTTERAALPDLDTFVGTTMDQARNTLVGHALYLPALYR